MKIVIDNKDYTAIENLKFDPSADVTGTSVPINELSCSIKTDDEIRYGDFASLYDDSGKLWAKYWITEVEEQNESFVYIIAQSMLLLLDRSTLSAKMYQGELAKDVIADIFKIAPKVEYTLDSSFDNIKISGFCPEQSAKDRLQWVCFVIGAYIKSFFTDKVEIIPLKEDSTTIPMFQTFWKPSVTYEDIVTDVKVRAFTFIEGEPGTTDNYVTADESTYYIQQTQVFTLKNRDVPETAATNTVEVDDVSIVNNDNVSEILSRLAKYYFNRTQVQFDVIDDGSYQPGQMLNVSLSRHGNIATGYAISASFSFGHAQRASISLRQVNIIAGVELIITNLFEGRSISQLTYQYPAGIEYMIQNAYLDAFIDGNRHILMPEKTHTKGVMLNTTTYDTTNYLCALKQVGELLYINIIDDISTSDGESGKELSIP